MPDGAILTPPPISQPEPVTPATPSIETPAETPETPTEPPAASPSDNPIGFPNDPTIPTEPNPEPVQPPTPVTPEPAPAAAPAPLPIEPSESGLPTVPSSSRTDPNVEKPVRSTTQPAPKPVSPSIKLAPKPTAKPTVKPAPKPTAKPAVRPATKGGAIIVRSTAYNSMSGQTDASPFRTATGARTRFGIVALSRDLLRRIPYGSRILLEDLGAWSGGKGKGKYNAMLSRMVFVVEDTMHPRKSGTVDVWFPARHQAIQWGARRLRLRIVQIGR